MHHAPLTLILVATIRIDAVEEHNGHRNVMNAVTSQVWKGNSHSVFRDTNSPHSLEGMECLNKPCMLLTSMRNTVLPNGEIKMIKEKLNLRQDYQCLKFLNVCSVKTHPYDC